MNAGRVYKEIDVHSSGRVGLVLTMYDMLIADLHRAIGAIRSGDIEGRTTEIKHALDVLQHLQGSIDFKNGGEAANHLDTFYAIVRAKVLQASMQSSAPLLEAQIEMISSVREAWHEVEGLENGGPKEEYLGNAMPPPTNGAPPAEVDWRA